MLKIAFTIIGILICSSVLCCGCAATRTNKVVIDRQFLSDIEKEMQEEAKTGEDRSEDKSIEYFRRLLQINRAEMIYLVTKGDRQAIDVSISLIGQKNNLAWRDEVIERVIIPIFEDNPVIAREVLEEKKDEVQIRVLSILDIYHPCGWSVYEYLNQHPKVKKLYEAKYGIETVPKHLPNVCIDRHFLYDIEKAFQQELKSGEDRSDIYNSLWEKHYDDLMYLTRRGDEKAIDVSISLIGQKGYPACLWEEVELILKPAFESDSDYFWKTLERKPRDEQVRILHVFDFYKPIDWEMEGYFAKHPEIEKLYATEYREDSSTEN